MFKKLAITAGVVAVGLGVLHATGLSSYTSTAAAKVRSTFKKSVPLEFELDRLRHEVSQLVPEMKKNFSNIAEEMVAVENLEREIKIASANLKKQKDNLLTMTESAETGRTIYIHNRPVSAEKVRARLDRDWANYKASEAELKSKEQLLEAKQSSLDATREKLGAIKGQKQQLEVEIAQLEAQLKTIRLSQARSKFHFDDSKLAHCKSILADIKNRLNVEMQQNLLENEFATDTITTEKQPTQPTSDLIREIRTQLGTSKDEVKSVAADNKD
jgi:predicted  nucleic acid-binding Zn-ribbon protein